MKQRIFMLAILISMVSLTGFAQLDVYNGKRPIVVGQDGVKHIIVEGSIGLVLRQGKSDGVNMRMDKSLDNKVKITLRNDKLYISAKEAVTGNDKPVVYAWFDNLESLTLSGNSIAASIGILDYKKLLVKVDEQARVSLRTTGEIQMIAPQNTPYSQQTKYNSVVVGER